MKIVMCVGMADMRKNDIMIENMIFTMSGYFMLENRSITKNKPSAYAIIKFDNGVSRRLVYFRYRSIFLK